MNLRNPQELEAFVRQRVAERGEPNKLDFKRELNFATTQQKLELVKDVNAIVNTYAQEFADHGFLIFGVDRADGAVRHPVPLLDTLGVDKLEAQIAQVLGTHVHPVPAVSLYRFDEPGVGAWGTLVIWPDQTPPFVFTRQASFKNGQGKSVAVWRQGEWRVRRNGVTCEPSVEDYGDLFRLRIQAAVQPLRAEIDALRVQLARLEGRMEAAREEARPQLSFGLLHEGEPASAITIVTAGQAAFEALGEDLPVFLEALDNMAPRHRDPTQVRWDGEPYHGFQPFPTGLMTIFSSPSDAVASAQRFLDQWNLHGSGEDRAITQVNTRRESGALVGPDAARATAYNRLLGLAYQRKESVNAAAEYAPYHDLHLTVRNGGTRATGTLKVTAEASLNDEPIQLYRFAPRQDPYRHGSRHEVFSSHSVGHKVPLAGPVDTHASLLPADTWHLQPFGLEIKVPGVLKIIITAFGEHLGGKQEAIFEIFVHVDDARQGLPFKF